MNQKFLIYNLSTTKKPVKKKVAAVFDHKNNFLSQASV